MLKIKEGIKISELKKYGFKILITDKQLKENIKKEPVYFYCTRAYKQVGHHFHIVIENDEYENQITIVPDNEFHMLLCVNWQLDTLYDLIKDGLVEKVSDEE